ncbi:unnamed protein product [Amoebophrya sp. A120]|nr:unnamed protein product [Amoebophrya sp. A120]|eukprot:GSA120T00022089001.1
MLEIETRTRFFVTGGAVFLFALYHKTASLSPFPKLFRFRLIIKQRTNLQDHDTHSIGKPQPCQGPLSFLFPIALHRSRNLSIHLLQVNRNADLSSICLSLTCPSSFFLFLRGVFFCPTRVSFLFGSLALVLF